MRKFYLFSFISFWFNSPIFAQSTTGNSLDNWVNETLGGPVQAFVDFIFYSVKIGNTEITLVIVWLILSALYFTLYFRFINIRGFGEGLRLLRGIFAKSDAPGEVSHFAALSTALAATVGIGNIGAIAFAIALGGPGATFWIIVAGFLGMSSKFVECTLGVKYRKQNPDGSVSGGPMYYLERGFAEKGWGKLGKVLGSVYAVGIVIGCLGIGNMFQSNQAFEQFLVVTGGNESFFVGRGWLFGLFLAVIVASVIIGGIKSIAKVTSRMVPLMAVLYVAGALVILVLNAAYIPKAISTIVSEAFHPTSMKGGMVGIMMLGFLRAVFSNEAGLGSAAIAHSAVKTSQPVTEGLVALLEPFIDTILVCTLTSLVIVTTLVAVPGFQESVAEGSNLAVGIKLTSAAFERHISWSPYVLIIVAILFAVSTMISWSYYGLKGWTYLVGEGRIKAMVFNLLFCVFIAIGSMMQLSTVIDFSDALVYFLCIPNIIGLYILAPVVKKELANYFEVKKRTKVSKP